MKQGRKGRASKICPPRTPNSDQRISTLVQTSAIRMVTRCGGNQVNEMKRQQTVSDFCGNVSRDTPPFQYRNTAQSLFQELGCSAVHVNR